MLSDNRSTTVEIILYYLTLNGILEYIYIYNSRNYSILLNNQRVSGGVIIYNSRNYSILLNNCSHHLGIEIYNSRNYSILLNKKDLNGLSGSTTVEIILYYLTTIRIRIIKISTTVEIILYYLTYVSNAYHIAIYNSRNYSILLNISAFRH